MNPPLEGCKDTGSSTRRFAEWVAKLEYEPKKRYAIQYAEYVLGVKPAPKQPSATWVPKTETKVRRLLGRAADMAQPSRLQGDDLSQPTPDVQQILSMLGFE